ncbi:hypothetical protein PR202_gb01861 [Eleusine coracana subsp. coracana]|uniref:Proteasome alpha-type subunits domain-containing protein n=1 Tax=Eleusine coracana subsp. coracana TaxID=191504 RepID=A0AAV5DXD9_ELECO|nr:hypothetical protein QOZ80_5BG0413940 [Eleusine coracana subsp. coracana]GJN14978.1 hypothetical protein PR202_gb01861 [Eleusine coracana subsp. coracana]
MFRNQYDTDVTTFSPHGRIFQMEYAMEAVKQGAATVGLCSCTHAVLVASNKPASELSSFQRKVFRVADHVGVAFSGLTADGRVLTKFLRNECINHAFVYEAQLPVSRLALRLADKAQVCTQRSWKRPYGVGLLVAGLDETGPHLYYNCPSGNYFEYQAFAIGSRSQAAKTFLERKFEGFNKYTPEQLIKDALSAIKETLQGEKLTSSNCTVAIVGRIEDGTAEPFQVVDTKRIQAIIDSMEAAEEAPAEPSSMQEEDKGSDAAPMDI